MRSLLPAAAAAALSWHCGFRFFAPIDTSVAFDGGYRILLGQVPFRDFVSPIGPVLYWLQALFFRFFGVNYSAYVALGCAMSAVGTLLASRRSLMGGLVTAVWFMSAYGGVPSYNNCAFLFLLASVAALERPALAGVLAAVSFFAKQPIGAAGALFLGLHYWVIGERRAARRFASAWALAAAILGAFIGSGGWAAFWRYFFVLPIADRALPLWKPLAVSAILLPWVWADSRRRAWPLATLALLALCVYARKTNASFFFLPLAAAPFLSPERRSLMAALSLIQAAAMLVSNGGDTQYLPFLGIQFSIAAEGWLDSGGGWTPVWAIFLSLILLGLRRAFHLPWLYRAPVAEPLLAAAALFAAWRLARGGRRRMAALALLFAGYELGHAVWYWRSGGMPVDDGISSPVAVLGGARIDPGDAAVIEEAAAYVKGLPADARPFFIYPECAALHALLGQPSPQPFVWFQEGLTYRSEEPDDSLLCEALARAGTRTILWDGEDEGAPDCLKRWRDSEFSIGNVSAHFRFYRKKA